MGGFLSSKLLMSEQPQTQEGHTVSPLNSQTQILKSYSTMQGKANTRESGSGELREREDFL